MAPGEGPADERELLEELRGAGGGGARLPEFFVVGHAKSGTTALHGMLQSHPAIFLPVLRETQFLARGPRERAEQPAAGQEARRPRTLEAYLALFEEARPDQRVGEISTAYLRTPETAARIAALRPDARIIAFFREPAGFLRSLHLQFLQVGFETERDFAKALALEGERREGRKIPPGCPWPRALLYGEQVRYAEQLRSYRELFGAERVLAIVYEDFRADNDGVVREVLRFLEVDDTVAIEPAEANPTVAVRSHRAERLMGSVSDGGGPLARGARSAVKALTPASLRRGALQAARKAVVDSSPPPADERLMAELRSRFKGQVLAAGDEMGRDLVAEWGYEEVV